MTNRTRLRRHGNLRLVKPDPVDDGIRVAVHVAQHSVARGYAAGWLDGAEDALWLALGEARHGVDPYTGPSLPAEFTRWAQQALAKIAEGQ